MLRARRVRSAPPAHSPSVLGGVRAAGLADPQIVTGTLVGCLAAAETVGMIDVPGYDRGSGRGYLAACTMGIPAQQTIDALRADLDRWRLGTATSARYTEVVERSRTHAATLLGTRPDRIALGSQISVFAAVVAASAAPGAEVLCVDGDFSSLVAPFLVRGDLQVRHVPVGALADEIRPSTAVVAFSVVQSATGEVADAASVSSAARDAGAFVLVDTTQATGWLPTRDLDADLIVCHAYKWLCAPRGAAFAAFSERAAAELAPIAAGWYSGSDP